MPFTRTAVVGDVVAVQVDLAVAVGRLHAQLLPGLLGVVRARDVGGSEVDSGFVDQRLTTGGVPVGPFGGVFGEGDGVLAAVTDGLAGSESDLDGSGAVFQR